MKVHLLVKTERHDVWQVWKGRLNRNQELPGNFFFSSSLKTWRWWIYRSCQCNSMMLKNGQKRIEFLKCLCLANRESGTICLVSIRQCGQQDRHNACILGMKNNKWEAWNWRAVTHKCLNLALRYSWAAPTGALAGKSIEFQGLKGTLGLLGATILCWNMDRFLGNNQTLTLTIWTKYNCLLSL